MDRSKAQTLLSLRDRLSQFTIPAFLCFGRAEWEARADECLQEVRDTFGGELLAVRSSAAGEDGRAASMAGKYESVLNVEAGDPGAVREAVDKVFASYGRREEEAEEEDEVLVQRMVSEPIMSGVVFTHDLNTGAPYYVINYDDISGKTDTVTSGDGEHANRTLYIHRSATDALRSERFRSLVSAVQELEEVAGSRFLDIEFAMGSDLTPHLLQVRAITTQPNWNRAVARRIDAALEGIQKFLRRRFGPMHGVFGESTVLGQMPDWNPAEMIGRAPRRLARSLYEILITDRAWRVAREEMGYRVPDGQPLMVSLAGQPFIDTRLSFHSFLPADLPEGIGRRLVTHWVEKLREEPQLHDKVEFEVATTVFSFDMEQRLGALPEDLLSREEKDTFREALRRMTVRLVEEGEDFPGSIANAMGRIEALRTCQRDRHPGPGEAGLPDLFRMADDCIRLGTIPFSILARHGFVARTLLLSLERRGILEAGEVNRLLSGVRTVAGELVDDMMRLQEGGMTRRDFMQRYGHLRPGTYDILSLRYDQMDDFGTAAPARGQHAAGHAGEEPLGLDGERKSRITELLREEGFDMDADGLLDYVQRATAGREYGKFVFTRSVSDILEIVARFAEENGLSRDEISHVPFGEILREATHSGEGPVEDRLRRISEEGAEQHAVSSAIRLPQVLYDEEGAHVVPFQVSQPNFITDKRVEAECVNLSPDEAPPSIEGKIVIIESADPGFDWIFAHQIGGLITKYGGANSHMAIRCAEFSIPAAIGCGEQKYELLVKANKISLDCTTGLIRTQL